LKYISKSTFRRRHYDHQHRRRRRHHRHLANVEMGHLFIRHTRNTTYMV